MTHPIYPYRGNVEGYSPGTQAYEAAKAYDPHVEARDAGELENPEEQEEPVETSNVVEPAPVPVINVTETPATRLRYATSHVTVSTTPQRVVSYLDNRKRLKILCVGTIIIGEQGSLLTNNGYYLSEDEFKTHTREEIWAASTTGTAEVYVWQEYETND